MASKRPPPKPSKSFFRLALLAGVQLIFFGTLLLLPGQNFYSTLEPKRSANAIEFTDLPEIALTAFPKNTRQIPPPQLTARAALALDIDSAVIMYEKNIREKLFPASTTKMMTALVSLETYPLDKIVTFTEVKVSPVKVNLEDQEKISVESLLFATLISSGNDAAEALAQVYPGGRSAFIDRMNQRAQELHLSDTHFVNPTGIDEEGHFSTALDLGRLASFALLNPEFAKIVSTQKTIVYSLDGKIEHKLTNVNELLGKLQGVVGVKTGYTQGAGESLVALTERNGHKILTVILGSTDRFGESTSLIEWAFANHEWLNPEIAP